MEVKDYTGIAILGGAALAGYLLYKNFNTSDANNNITSSGGNTQTTPNPINNVITTPNPIIQQLPTNYSGNSFLELIYSEEQKLIDFYNKTVDLTKGIKTGVPELVPTQQQIKVGADAWLQKATSQSNIDLNNKVNSNINAKKINQVVADSVQQTNQTVINAVNAANNKQFVEIFNKQGLTAATKFAQSIQTK